MRFIGGVHKYLAYIVLVATMKTLIVNSICVYLRFSTIRKESTNMKEYKYKIHHYKGTCITQKKYDKYKDKESIYTSITNIGERWYYINTVKMFKMNTRKLSLFRYDRRFITVFNPLADEGIKIYSRKRG